MIEIVKANVKEKEQVLKLLDDFRTACFRMSDHNSTDISTSAKEFGPKVFDEVIDSKSSAVFLAKDDKEYIGVVTIHKIPQIRKGIFCGEIEEMFVNEDFQGKGVAQRLLRAAETWARKEKIGEVRLESGNELERAHAFYEKSGFIFYGKAYKKKLA